MEETPLVTIPRIANWSENFAFAGFDPNSGIELFLHIGRWRRDLTLWREVVCIALPDDTVLVHRALGNARATLRGPGGANFAVEVVEPEKASIRLRFHGGVRRVPADVLFQQVLNDGPHFRLRFDFSYEGAAAKWDLGRIGHKTEFMGAGHIEQFGRLTGDIELEGERFTFDSLINRDHSRGPRVFDSNVRHHWLQGYLSDGLMFQLYEAEVAGKMEPAYSEANVVEDGISYDAKVAIHDKLPFSDNRGLIKRPVRLSLEYAGKLLELTARSFVRTISIQSTSPNDMYVGRRQEDRVQNTTVVEQGVLYETADGRQGFGHMERLVPGKLLVDPA